MRKTFAITIFYFYLSAATVLLEVVGVTAAWGVDSPTGVTNSVANVTAALENIEPGGGLGDTLFGIFIAVTQSIEALGQALFALPLLLVAVGIPAVFVTFLFAPMPIILGRDVIHAVSGRFG